MAEFGDKIISVLKDNGGQASAFNSGFEASSGEIITYLDADDILLPTALEKVVALFVDVEVVTVHWPLFKVDINRKLTGEIAPKQPLPEGNFKDQLIKYGPEHWKNTPLPCGHAYSRRFLDFILPIPEKEFKAGADFYIFVLAPIFGTLKRISEPQAFYRIHGSNDTLKPLDEYIVRYLNWYEQAAIAITKHLHAQGIEVSPDKWPQESWYHQINKSLEEINQHVPLNESYILVDENQWMSNDSIYGRHRIPFMEKDGLYLGKPENDDIAINEIERLLKKIRWVFFFPALPSGGWNIIAGCIII
jgi:glycosyltransferase involved in cell wall biosynthesis